MEQNKAFCFQGGYNLTWKMNDVYLRRINFPKKLKMQKKIQGLKPTSGGKRPMLRSGTQELFVWKYTPLVVNESSIHHTSS